MNWYCIHTRPLKEEGIRRFCAGSLGVETYFPRLRQQRTIRRVRRTVTRPLFPRYLFCRFDPAAHYRAVKHAPDVISIVHRGSEPAIVADPVIQDLRRWAGDAFEAPRQPPLHPGEIVLIKDGPLVGLSAIVQEDLNDDERVAVLLMFLDCGARSVVNRSQLQLVS